jgi:hypothetical protein
MVPPFSPRPGYTSTLVVLGSLSDFRTRLRGEMGPEIKVGGGGEGLSLARRTWCRGLF